MSAALYTLSIEQGATLTRTFTVADDGVARPLTGYSARLQIRVSQTNRTLLALWSTTTGHLTIDAPIGQIVLLVPAVQTATLAFATGVYDLEIEAPDGTVERLLQGSATLSYEVTT